MTDAIRRELQYDGRDGNPVSEEDIAHSIAIIEAGEAAEA